MSSMAMKFYNCLVLPSKPFDQCPPPEAPDYTDHGPRAWSAFPGRDPALNSAELRPPSPLRKKKDDGSPPSSSSSTPVSRQGEEGEEEEGHLPHLAEEERPVDCFYLNPTTYGIFPQPFTKAYYNGPMDNTCSNLGIEMCLATQASVFNPLCRIYAPRYRQCTLAGRGVVEDRLQAYELAYSDAKRAFDYFLTHLNKGERPFIMAAHSQGTRLMVRLLAECIEGHPERVDRLICAYLIGGGVPMSIFKKDLPALYPSSGPVDVGGAVCGWDTIPQAGTWEVLGEDERYLATNPVTWVTPGYEKEDSSTTTTKSKHLGLLHASWGWGNRAKYGTGLFGGLSVKNLNCPPVMLKEGFTVETRKEWDFVVVPRVPDYLPHRSGFYRQTVFGGTYHLQDYALFYFNIQQNAVDRIKVYLDKKGLSKGTKKKEEVKEEK